MSRVVVADAGPLIALARTGHIRLLRELYGTVIVPPLVLAELRVEENRPGSRALRTVVSEGWLLETQLRKTSARASLPPAVDPGEAEAVLLAEEVDLRFLLIDERRGRLLAQRRGLPVVGTGGVLLVAKEKGLVDRVATVLGELAKAGYHFSAQLRATLLHLAGESER